MKHMYIVKYNGGSYEDYYEKDIFVTDSFEVAEKYVSKFNSILCKWKLYYDRLYRECDWDDDSDVRQQIYMNRGDWVLDTSKCYFEVIEVR